MFSRTNGGKKFAANEAFFCYIMFGTYSSHSHFYTFSSVRVPYFASMISYPAMRPEVISIAAVGKFIGLPTAWFSNTNAQVDYAGIGEDVHSFKPGGGLQQMSGESF